MNRRNIYKYLLLDIIKCGNKNESAKILLRLDNNGYIMQQYHWFHKLFQAIPIISLQIIE